MLYCDAGVRKADPRSALRQRSPTMKDRGRTRRIVRLLLLLVSLIIVVDALVGDRGLLAMLQARKDYDDLTFAVARQRAENGRLREEARRLRDDPLAIEEIARRELGLIRPGEKLFIIKDLPQPSQIGPPAAPGPAPAPAPPR